LISVRCRRGARCRKERDGVTEFEGRNQQLDYHRVVGGQLLGQFIRIASATCPAKTVKSQHVVFTKEAGPTNPFATKPAAARACPGDSENHWRR